MIYNVALHDDVRKFKSGWPMPYPFLVELQRQPQLIYIGTRNCDIVRKGGGKSVLQRARNGLEMVNIAGPGRVTSLLQLG